MTQGEIRGNSMAVPLFHLYSLFAHPLLFCLQISPFQFPVLDGPTRFPLCAFQFPLFAKFPFPSDPLFGCHGNLFPLCLLPSKGKDEQTSLEKTIFFQFFSRLFATQRTSLQCARLGQQIECWVHVSRAKRGLHLLIAVINMANKVSRIS